MPGIDEVLVDEKEVTEVSLYRVSIFSKILKGLEDPSLVPSVSLSFYLYIWGPQFEIFQGIHFK